MEIYAAKIIPEIILDVCPKCGVQFGMTEETRKAFRRVGKTFVCFNGHKLHYPQDPSPSPTATAAPTAAQVRQLKRELVQAAHRAEQAEARAQTIL